MLTPQEVSSHAFPKAVMGGYNMSSVDEFLDELTDDYTSLYKENTALKAKMKVLVEKVEDYRATEDSMRATLLTAQKMADSIVKEAEQKRDEMLSQTENEARVKIGQLQQEAITAQERVKAGQQALADFISSAKAACAKELEYLNELPELPMETEAAAEEPEKPEEQKPKVDEIEQNVFASFDGQKTEETPVPEEVEQPEEDAKEDYPAENPFEEEKESSHMDDPTRRINLSELKFGRNYSDSKKTMR